MGGMRRTRTCVRWANEQEVKTGDGIEMSGIETSGR